MLVVVGRRTTTTTTTTMMLVNHPSKKSSSFRRITPPFTQVVSKNRRQNRALLFSSKKEIEQKTALAANNNGLATQIEADKTSSAFRNRDEASRRSSSRGRRMERRRGVSRVCDNENTSNRKRRIVSISVSLPKNDIEESMMLKNSPSLDSSCR